MGKHYNRPTAELVKTTYASPPDPQNPVLRGLPLYYSSILISSSSLLSRYLWGTAGFTTLRNLEELKEYTPRYDPTVCPISDDADQSDTRDLQSDLGDLIVPAKFGQKYPSVADYAAAYKSGSITPSAVAEVLLPLVNRDVDPKSQHSTAFLQTKADEVRKAVEASTKRWSSGAQLGPLDGVPVAVKDEVDIEGYQKSLGSSWSLKVRGTSWCVEKLIEAGAIIIGKSTMHELGLDTSGNDPIHGTPRNPYNDDYYCGGSSSGSAYAVAAGLVPLAVGADGGGSIRIPASFCGVYGLKTTHGRASKRPTPNDAASNSVVGPIGATMLDIEAGFRVMATPDPDDATSSCFSPPVTTSGLPKNRILGIYKPWFDRAPPSVRDPCYAAIDYLRDELDYRVVDIEIPHLHAGQLAHAMTALTEISAAHSSVAGLVPPSKILLSVGRHTPAADFLLAQRLRALLMQHLSALFAQHPGLVIVTPTSAIPGWPISGGETELRYGASDANTSTRNMEFVWLANFCGCPSLQAPVGYVDEVLGKGKIPVGIMGMTEWGADEPLIGWGYDVEKWLHEGRKEGRLQPPNWVDVIAMAKKKGSA